MTYKEDLTIEDNNRLYLGQEPPTRLIDIKMKKEEFLKYYTLRGRIGIYILVLLGVANLKLIK